MCAKLSDFPQPVLAVDCSLGGCIAAVLTPRADSVVTREIETDREQAAKLVPLVQDAMAEAGVAFADLGLIVTTVGPGSFTGLRIGLTSARAWGLALNLPVQGMSTLEIMARSCETPDAKSYTVLLESKRSDYYIQSFSQRFDPVSVAGCAEAADIEVNEGLFCGDAIARFEKERGMTLPRKSVRKLLDAEVLARAGLARFIANGGKADKAEPVYLRGADVSLSAKKSREIRDYP